MRAGIGTSGMTALASTLMRNTTLKTLKWVNYIRDTTVFRLCYTTQPYGQLHESPRGDSDSASVISQ
jgi:hypothetical protein